MSKSTHSDKHLLTTGNGVTDELQIVLEKEDTLIMWVWYLEISQYDPMTKTGGIRTEYKNTFLVVIKKAMDDRFGASLKCKKIIHP